MTYIRLRSALKNYPIFSLSDIRKVDPRFHRRRLNDWQDKGYIRKVIKGTYVFSDLDLNEPLLFEIANKIYNPSYISFEMALSYYRIIPETVYEITSASTRRTYRFRTSLAHFRYQTINKKLFFGYNLIANGNKVFKIASVEKALLDFLYLNPQHRRNNDFAELRINADLFFEQINQRKLGLYLKKFKVKSLNRRIHALVRFLHHA